MENQKVTVGQMIESLKRFDTNDTVEIMITQYNKVYPIAYCVPNRNKHTGGTYYATRENGSCVRIGVSLPSDEETFMITGTRKK